ncbi:mRNA interferase MazF [Sphingomonas rubra]|uniref:mRNA interferase MazF n=2 Tax=Sphingomonas rubra TaxID=634430 RepID=A0A1I5T544_9SPHN|nr:mRNA interferase MazF [Sphingomonas rubra]
MHFEPGDIVQAPFPHVERAVVVRRPALLLCSFDTDEAAIGLLAWVLMITSARRPRWRGDLDIPDAERLGLIIPSRVRTAKVATVAAIDLVRIGRMDKAVAAQAKSIVLEALGVS